MAVNTDELYELYKRRYAGGVKRARDISLGEIGRANAGVRDYMKAATDQAAARAMGEMSDAVPAYSAADYQRYLSEGQDGNGRAAFSYDPGKDPVFNAYQKAADRETRTVYQDYLAKASARTGGIASSYAAQVAARAAAEAAQGANTILANLYKNAYNKYASGYKDPDYSTPLSEAGGAATPTVPTAQQTLPGILPSSTMQAGDVPGYDRPAESAYIPAETVTADPREKYRPTVQPSLPGDASGGSRAYTAEGGKLYYGDGDGGIYTLDDGTPIEVQYDDDGNKLSLDDAVAAMESTVSDDAETTEAGDYADMSEEVEKEYADVPSDKVYEDADSLAKTIQAIDDEMAEIEEEASGLDPNSKRFAELSDRYSDLYDRRNEAYDRYTETSATARQKANQERVQMLRDIAEETGGVISDPDDWQTITDNFTPREIAQAGLTFQEGSSAEYMDFDDAFAMVSSQLSEDDKDNISQEVDDAFGSATNATIVNSDEYKTLESRIESGDATPEDIYRYGLIHDILVGNVKSEQYASSKDKYDVLTSTDRKDIFSIYEDGGITDQDDWKMLVDMYGLYQLEANGIYMK